MDKDGGRNTCETTLSDLEDISELGIGDFPASPMKGMFCVFNSLLNHEYTYWDIMHFCSQPDIVEETATYDAACDKVSLGTVVLRMGMVPKCFGAMIDSVVHLLLSLLLLTQEQKSRNFLDV
jgi:hypothetical protein